MFLQHVENIENELALKKQVQQLGIYLFHTP